MLSMTCGIEWKAIVATAALTTGLGTGLREGCAGEAPLEAASGCPPGCLDAVTAGPTMIPDGDRAGVTIGPLAIRRDGSLIEDVVLELDITHPCPSDVSVWLVYDADNDGVSEAQTPIDLYLARPKNRDASPGWACPVRLDGKYFFRHETVTEGLPDWEPGSLAAFRGLDKGGSFRLRVVDAEAGDRGTVAGCTVHVR